METIETSGRSVEEAIEVGLILLDASRDQVQIEILDSGKVGFLGFRAIESKVRISRILKNDVTLMGKQIIEKLLDYLEVEADISISTIKEKDSNTPIIEISGADAGLLIGRHGATLTSLQFIVNAILGRSQGSRILIDVEEYRKKRILILENLASRVASSAISSRKSITLEPMPANERRTIHLTLADNQMVDTHSTGSDQDRRVVVTPSNNQRGNTNRR
jgi:spoIIIJ-associated protein